MTDGRIMGNILIIDLAPNPPVIKTLSIILKSQLFLGQHLGFHIFFSQWPSSGLENFFTARLDFTSFLQLHTV